MSDVPNFLRDYAETWPEAPRQACKDWFAGARFGLFLHYGLYSLLGRHEWVQYREQIPVAAYAQLQHHFTAHNFDADAIAALAVDAGMKYVCITTRHHDSFCLWDTAQTTFNSVQAPCGRDLVAELAEACDKRALGLCLYYSHGRDWKHPHAPNNDKYGGAARPEYDPPEPTYATGDAHDLDCYLHYMTAQITELLTNYGPIASIWLDGIATPRNGDSDAFKCQELYDHIHSLQPQVLVSYKDGLLGTEDYFAPEQGWDLEKLAGTDKICEVCGCMSGGWGYTAGTEHKDCDQLWQTLAEMRKHGFNWLLNTGPLPDGAIDPRDAATLRQIGERIRREGFPQA
jgi:alpha-L-fucosidase